MQELFTNTQVWKGISNTTLDTFISKHHTYHVILFHFVEYFLYQLPNKSSKVTHPLENIKTPGLHFHAIVSVGVYDGSNGNGWL